MFNGIKTIKSIKFYLVWSLFPQRNKILSDFCVIEPSCIILSSLTFSLLYKSVLVKESITWCSVQNSNVSFLKKIEQMWSFSSHCLGDTEMNGQKRYSALVAAEKVLKFSDDQFGS